MDVRHYNRQAWNQQVRQQNRWTVPVSDRAIDEARQGRWDLVLTPTLPVPRDWFGDLHQCHVLCLASGGGQQAPLLAAAGAQVTVLDNSPAQLSGDCALAQQHALHLQAILGDMCDLSMFDDSCFDLIFHPVANCFVPDVRPVWRESHRVLRAGGALLSGFCNPVRYLFDPLATSATELSVIHQIPYSDLHSLSADKREQLAARHEPLEFGHTLDDLVGGQIKAGFAVVGFYEDRCSEDENDPLSSFIASFAATRAQKGVHPADKPPGEM